MLLPGPIDHSQFPAMWRSPSLNLAAHFFRASKTETHPTISYLTPNYSAQNCTHTHTHTHVYVVRMTSYCFSYIQWVRSKKATGSAYTQGKGSHKKGSPSLTGGHLVEHLPNYAQHIDFNVKFKSQHSSLITKHWSLNKTELSIYAW